MISKCYCSISHVNDISIIPISIRKNMHPVNRVLTGSSLKTFYNLLGNIHPTAFRELLGNIHLTVFRESLGNIHLTALCKLLRKTSKLRLEKKIKKMKKVLAFPLKIVYSIPCCDMIAKKREVAANRAGFPWSECQVKKLATSHCIQ